MTSPIQYQVQFSSAALRLAGHAFSSNLRAAGFFAKSACELPQIQARVIQMAALSFLPTLDEKDDEPAMNAGPAEKKAAKPTTRRRTKPTVRKGARKRPPAPQTAKKTAARLSAEKAPVKTEPQKAAVSPAKPTTTATAPVRKRPRAPSKPPAMPASGADKAG